MYMYYIEITFFNWKLEFGDDKLNGILEFLFEYFFAFIIYSIIIIIITTISTIGNLFLYKIDRTT